MVQFFRGMPQDLSDAARMDGCSELGIWWRIVMPLSKPVLATIAIFTFQFAWNWFLQPLLYLGTKADLWTLSLALQYFAGSEQEVRTELQMAMAILMFLPMLLVYIVGEKHLVRGVTFSGLHGS
jgi:ABC-type glycerol-3-phosphate transport system permease component